MSRPSAIDGSKWRAVASAAENQSRPPLKKRSRSNMGNAQGRRIALQAHLGRLDTDILHHMRIARFERSAVDCPDRTAERSDRRQFPRSG